MIRNHMRPAQAVILVLMMAACAALARAQSEPSRSTDHIMTGVPMQTDTAGRSGKVATSAVVRVICTAEGTGGTGFLHKSGRVISAALVVDSCDKTKIFVVASSGKSRAVSNVQSDAILDLALLTLETKLSGKPLPIGLSTKMVVGAQVTTWGFPVGYRGLRPLLSVGYLAGVDRVKVGGKLSPDKWVVNAAFNSDNSGGPVLNVEDGTVIGVVSSKLAPISPLIESALQALISQQSGFMYTRTHPDGMKESISEGRVIGEVLRYLRSQTQLVVGHATQADELRDFLKASGVQP